MMADTNDKSTETQNNGAGGNFAHVKIPAAFVRPYTHTTEDGRSFDKAYVDIPQGTRLNGIDIGGFTMDVFMNSRMKQQMLSGGQPTLSFKADEKVAIWKGKRDDPGNPYQRYEVDPWSLAGSLKEEFDSFKTAKAAEREAAKEEKGASLKVEAADGRASSAALSGHEGTEDPQPVR